MRINFEIKMPSLRPSNLLRGAENGVLSAADFIGSKTSKAAHIVRTEYRARQLANAHKAYEQAVMAGDLREILDRAAELLGAKQAAASHEDAPLGV